MARVIRGFWYLSILIVFSGLMYVYASLPDTVIYNQESSAISRDSVFYVFLAIVALSNFALFGLARKFALRPSKLSDPMQGWLYAFSFFLNIFYFIAMTYVSMYNSGESWNFEFYAYFIYISLGFIALCIFSLPLVMINVFKSKQL